MCLAIPAEVTELLPGDMARINVDGVGKVISVTLVENIKVGDYVIVHVGYALARLDPEEARRTLDLLAQLDGLAAQIPS